MFLFSCHVTLYKLSKNISADEVEDPNIQDIYEIVNVCLASRDTTESKAIWNVEDKLMPQPCWANPIYADDVKDFYIKEGASRIDSIPHDTVSVKLVPEKLIKGPRLISSDTLLKIRAKALQARDTSIFWDEYDKKYSGTLVTITKPAFSKNKTAAIVFISHVDGSLSGQGFKYLLRKKAGKWNVEKISFLWIS